MWGRNGLANIPIRDEKVENGGRQIAENGRGVVEQIRQLELSAEQKQALQAQYQATNNRRWQERIQCVLLKGQGLTLEQIAEVIPYHLNTLSSWVRAYQARGLEGLLVWEYVGSPAHLTS